MKVLWKDVPGRGNRNFKGFDQGVNLVVEEEQETGWDVFFKGGGSRR